MVSALRGVVEGMLNRSGHHHPSRSITLSALAALMVSVGFAVSTGANGSGAVARAAAPPGDPTITVHAGGVRVNNSRTVTPLPNGAVFTATAVDDTALVHPCTIVNGTCTIAIPDTEAGHQWDVTETTPPPGYYLNPQLGSTPGNTSNTMGPILTTAPYTFRTATLAAGQAVDVPGNVPTGIFTDNRAPAATAAQRFSGLFATSRDDPQAPARCGLNIALVLDQSNSFALGDRQASLKTAANNAVDALTGTPSRLALFTFGAGAGPGVAPLETTAANAGTFHNFINGMTPNQGVTNYDAGLGQVTTSGTHFDQVIFVTDGSPTTSSLPGRGGNGTTSYFSDTEQGVFSANAIKEAGTRIVGLGVGLAELNAETNFRAVTGANGGANGPDWFDREPADFGPLLTQLVTGACASTLTIEKQIQDAQGNLLPNSTLANGWTFANTISQGTITSPVTTAEINGENGFGEATITGFASGTARVTVTETLKPGFTFVSAQCSVDGTGVPTDVTSPTPETRMASFTAQALVPANCTFTNRQVAPPPTPTPTPTVPPKPVPTPTAPHKPSPTPPPKVPGLPKTGFGGTSDGRGSASP